ncbi:unnamed protein product, partial [Nesidiocoris tenuis]
MAGFSAGSKRTLSWRWERSPSWRKNSPAGKKTSLLRSIMPRSGKPKLTSTAATPSSFRRRSAPSYRVLLAAGRPAVRHLRR